MALLQGVELGRAVEEMARRGAHFFHACQLKDLRTYLALGGIPSREAMEESGRPYTPFASDDVDRKNGAWGKVFGNLSDFGFGFAGAEWKREDTAPVPNPYGPILLELGPEALLEADDVAICLRSAGGHDFRRENESLGTAEEVARLFAKDFDPAGGYANAYIKYSDDLRRSFPDRVMPASAPGWTTLNPEVSCSVQGGRLSFARLSRVVVDRYRIGGTALVDLVARDLRGAGIRTRVQSRHYRPGVGREVILDDLIQVLANGPCGVEGFLAAESISPQSQEWGRRVRAGHLAWVFERFSAYLHSGTLVEMRCG